MARTTVLIPTHDHGPVIASAIASVQGQTEPDLEILVVGDGAPPITGDVVAALSRSDPRIKWLPHEKGEGHGELWRHEALAKATGDAVCYNADDDLWLPHHVATLRLLLRDADFANTLHQGVMPDGAIHLRYGDLGEAPVRARMLDERWNVIGPTCVGHSMQAYRRLPHGWRPRPEGMYSDLHMWRQWIEQPWCRFRSHPLPTTLHFASPDRKARTTEERCLELAEWLSRSVDPGLRLELESGAVLRRDRARFPTEPLLRAANALQKASGQGAAIDLLEAAHAAEPDTVAFGEAFAMALLKEGRQAQALEVVDKAAQRWKSDVMGQLAVGVVLLKAGRIEDAVAIGVAASAVSNLSALARYRVSVLLHRGGHVAEALGHARGAVAAQPGRDTFAKWLSKIEVKAADAT